MDNKEIPQELMEHIEKMQVAVDNSGAKCVDGGYGEDQAIGKLAIPGGHLGVSMALLKLGFSPTESFNMVHDYVFSNGGTYGWHTDTHEGHDGVVTGCGHCNAAIKQGEEYDLDGSRVQQLLDLIRSATDDGEKAMEKVILDREHEEKAILVITGKEATVKPWDQEKDNQYFIYDQARHQEFLQNLVDELKKQDYKVEYDELWDASQAQTTATLGLLGSSKGKPMYSVNVDGEIPVVEYLKDAPVLE